VTVGTSAPGSMAATPGGTPPRIATRPGATIVARTVVPTGLVVAPAVAPKAKVVDRPVAAQIGVTTRRRGKPARRAKSDERAAATLEAKLRAAGLTDVRVRVLKGKARQGARVRMDGIPLAKMRTLCQAICGAKR